MVNQNHSTVDRCMISTFEHVFECDRIKSEHSFAHATRLLFLTLILLVATSHKGKRSDLIYLDSNFLQPKNSDLTNGACIFFIGTIIL